MTQPTAAKTLSVTINRGASEAYDFLSVPVHFAKWASGLAASLRNVDGQWWADSPTGPVRIRFSAPNAFGILDHWVILQPDITVYVPLRVVTNGIGCELLLTLFRQPGMSDGQYESDAEWVLKDLQAAKRVLEEQCH